MKMDLAIPYDRVNSKHQFISKQVILDALYRKGFTDSSIVINEETKIIYVLIEVTDIKDEGRYEFQAEIGDNDELFPAAPAERTRK